MTISTLSFTSASAENKNIVVDFESLYADKKEIRVGENNIIGIRIESNEEVLVNCGIYNNEKGIQAAQFFSYDSNSKDYKLYFGAENDLNNYPGKWEIGWIRLLNTNYDTIVEYYDVNVDEMAKNWDVNKVDLSAASFTVINSNDDTSAPIIDVSALCISKNIEYCGKMVNFSLKVSDASQLNCISIQYYKKEDYPSYYSTFGKVFLKYDLIEYYDSVTNTYNLPLLISDVATYELYRIVVDDIYHNQAIIYNSKYCFYNNEQPAYDLSRLNLEAIAGEQNEQNLKTLARQIAHIEPITDMTIADVNGDKTVNAEDLTALARKVAKID